MYSVNTFKTGVEQLLQRELEMANVEVSLCDSLGMFVPASVTRRNDFHIVD